MDIKKAQVCAYENAKDRGYPVDSRSTLKHLFSELFELEEALIKFREKKGSILDVESEIADIVICSLTLATDLKIDLEQAVMNKMRFNESRTKTARELKSFYEQN